MLWLGRLWEVATRRREVQRARILDRERRLIRERRAALEAAGDGIEVVGGRALPAVAVYTRPASLPAAAASAAGSTRSVRAAAAALLTRPVPDAPARSRVLAALPLRRDWDPSALMAAVTSTCPAPSQAPPPASTLAVTARPPGPRPGGVVPLWVGVATV
ncbi:hypothetical protein GCM10022245_46690 [Streptomyces mayteni]